MLVSTLDHAAQAVYRDADARVYDDVGCLATDAGARSGEHRFFVHTRAGGWTDVEEARFVREPFVRTPMNYGIVALTGAEAAARPAGDVLTWAQLVERLEDQP
jgi:hypothetical protein